MPERFCSQRDPDKIQAQHRVRDPHRHALKHHQPQHHADAQRQQGQAEPEDDMPPTSAAFCRARGLFLAELARAAQ
ncbi:hypothetical protein D3C76_1624560 [compost metagenome]